MCHVTTENCRDISIHTPLAGSDVFRLDACRCTTYFNPHSPCGERLAEPSETADMLIISIHTPLAGSDLAICGFSKVCSDFNPHSPCGERPLPRRNLRCASYFNPHSPCGERPLRIRSGAGRRNFNPHSPCGERPFIHERSEESFDFNPHSPCGERLRQVRETINGNVISIHTPLAGSDSIPWPYS